MTAFALEYEALTNRVSYINEVHDALLKPRISVTAETPGEDGTAWFLWLSTRERPVTRMGGRELEQELLSYQGRMRASA